MKQLLSFQQFNEAKVLLSKSDQQSRLRGLALVLHGNFNAVGWPYMDADLMPIVVTAVQQTRSDSANFTSITRPHGRMAKMCRLKPAHYILLMAGEALAMALGWSLMQQQDTSSEMQVKAAAGVTESAQRVLMRLSGNFASALSNADGSANAALASGGVTAIHDEHGAIPADVVMTTQLLGEFDLHPKKIAWLMQDLLYQVSKGPAQNQRHAPSLQQMQAAADAMVAMASSTSGVVLDPKATAAASMAAINASQQLVDWGSPATQAALAEAQPEGSTLEAQMSLAQNLSMWTTATV
ncbi:hypothetical protein OEZ85_010194 [Tetradesmus obliquus]|uniref:Uncharacterized protein n=1 Tax=Tetradesmus obliquus TaxID=3088 RepID=A0ABY8TLJ7_TETOB|nr:hypothetical protein OEZ85_010194 [Tetradesmus obliquus]